MKLQNRNKWEDEELQAMRGIPKAYSGGSMKASTKGSTKGTAEPDRRSGDEDNKNCPPSPISDEAMMLSSTSPLNVFGREFSPSGADQRKSREEANNEDE
eukprot:CAMPEP_0167803958 /NCGR_PEP_ID=MMETSP0111_2-20121227/20180_1 /TAXON_ID=91324 /ORGANISM="Lotharella globosa, Strain CCCM811" /LENGTH=99 /DNA_ID=CAMNT_0007700595 /DNA_START=17 /DNA_END=316 /DNA_ORIENTATION=-